MENKFETAKRLFRDGAPVGTEISEIHAKVCGEVTIIEEDRIETQGKVKLAMSLASLKRMLDHKASQLEAMKRQGKSNRYLEREVELLGEHILAVGWYLEDQDMLFAKFYKLHNSEVEMLTDVVAQMAEIGERFRGCMSGIDPMVVQMLIEKLELHEQKTT